MDVAQNEAKGMARNVGRNVGPCADPHRGRGQCGTSLIETLIAISVLGILVAGVTTGIITSLRVTSVSNNAQRVNVLLTSFGEAIKQLPYQSCLSLADYNNAYQAYEDRLRSDDQPVLSGPDSTVTLTGVKYGTANSCTAGGQDPGYLVFTA